MNLKNFELLDSIEEFSFNDYINLQKYQDIFLKYFNVEIYELPEKEPIIKYFHKLKKV